MSMNHPRLRSRALAAAAALILGTGVALTGATAASATAGDFVVSTSAGDDSVGSLIWALNEANSDPDPSTITFSIAGAIHLDAGFSLPSIGYDTTIDGPGSDQLVVENTDATGYVYWAWSCGGTPLNVVVEGISFSGFIDTLAFSCVNATVTDVSIDHGTGDGYAFYAQDSNLVVDDVEVDANGRSGAYVTDSDGTASHADIDGFSISDYGNVGFVYTASGAGNEGTLSDINVEYGTGYGIDLSATNGAHFDASDLYVVDSADYGLWTYCDDASFTVTGGEFVSNGANGVGSSVFDCEFEFSDITSTDSVYNGLYLWADDSTGVVSGLTASSDQGARGLGMQLTDDSDITLRDSWIHNNDVISNVGGGAYLSIQNSALTFLRVDITNNSATYGGGGIELDTIAGADARFNLTDSNVSGNDTPQGGGAGIDMYQVGGTGPVGGVVISGTTIADNEAGYDGGGIRIVGASSISGNPDAPVVLIESSTIARNEATDGWGGGLYVYFDDDPYPHAQGPIRVLNTTITGNYAKYEGGGAYIEAENDLSQIIFAFSTIADNESGEGDTGGIYLWDPPILTASFTHTIVADNSGFDLTRGGDTVLDINWSLVENPDQTAQDGFDGTDGLDDGVGNIVGVDPLLGPLADNGGPTQTMALLEGSPAINAGNPSPGVDEIPGSDQRGTSRAGRADIGAYELTTLALAATGVSPVVPVTAVVLLLVGGIALVARRTRVQA
jgi:hypothetical protein